MLIIPYRVKNPWKRFPYATVSIILINVLVYSLTSEYFLTIQEDALKNYAFQFGVSPFLNIIWALFLHENIMHIGGNMLFLWVFGPPVEDRLGVPRYLLVYFITGIFGSLLNSIMSVCMHGENLLTLGASGCIMGVMGAYWYLFSWSTVCVFYWLFFFWRGVWEITAFWVVGAYISLDLFEGFTSGHGGGVANFAHVGGGLSGVLLCLAMKMRRDTEAVSQAKATQAEVKDLSLVPLGDLEIMREADPLEPNLIRAMLRPALSLGREDMIHRAFRAAGPALIEKDPGLVTQYLVALHGDDTVYQAANLMRLAHHAEANAKPRNAIKLYEMIVDHYPKSADLEMALYRLAQCYWEQCQDAPRARTCLQALLQHFPFGSLEQRAKMLLRKMP